jgi:hypothetical protein
MSFNGVAYKLVTLNEELLRFEGVVETKFPDGRIVLQLISSRQQLLHDLLDLAALRMFALDHLELQI